MFPANLSGPQVRWRPVFKIEVRLREIEAGSGAPAQGKAVEVLTTCHWEDSCAQARRSHDRGTSLFGKQTAQLLPEQSSPCCCLSEWLGVNRMSAAGQTINDRILAARHSLAGQVDNLVSDSYFEKCLKTYRITKPHNIALFKPSYFQGLAKAVCKATTEEIIGPKKKHLDCK